MQWHKVKFYEWTHDGHKIPGHTRTIICWHGLARNAHDFDYLAQHLVKEIPNARVIAVDTPGRGQSEKLLNPVLYNLQTYAIVFMNIYNVVGQPESLEWIGTSMGGMLGMLLSAAFINCPIKKLILVDIGPFISGVAMERIRSYVGKDPKFKDLVEAEQYFRSVYTQMGSLTDLEWQHMTKYLTKKMIESEQVALHYDPGIAAAFASKPAAAATANTTDSANSGLPIPSDEVDLWALWDLIKTPVMVVHGAKSDVLSVSTVEKMQSRGPKLAKLVTFQDCGHTPHLFNQEKCRDIIDWLKQ